MFKKLFVVASLLLCGCGTKYTTHGVVFDRAYTPSQTSTGVGPNLGKGGGVVVTVNTSSEIYTVFVRFDDGRVEPIEVSKSVWVQAEKGRDVLLACNTRWGCDITEVK